jgi:hypothetical protein
MFDRIPSRVHQAALLAGLVIVPGSAFGQNGATIGDTSVVPPRAAEPSPDVRETPSREADTSWLNGTNRQPASLLGTGPVTFSLYTDVYYAWQFRRPIDHTIFPGTVAPRHNELGINLVAVGIDVTGLDGPIGRAVLQYGSYVETVAGQDVSTRRGYFLSNSFVRHIQQAAVGWHFRWLHGANVEFGIFPSYVGLESYLPQENWNYTHALVSDFTPYYFAGARIQVFPTPCFKVELWAVNGWQTFGKWQETPGGGYSVNWRPADWISATHLAYVGREFPGHQSSLRVYSDNSLQVRYYADSSQRFFRAAAFSIVGDLGYEHRGNAPDGPMAAGALAHRVEWTAEWATAVRFDLFYDRAQALVSQLPSGSPYSLPEKGSFLGGGGTVTLDFTPSPWILFRLEYARRLANLPYFSGRGGITGPDGIAPEPTQIGSFSPDLRKSDDRIIANATLRL